MNGEGSITANETKMVYTSLLQRRGIPDKVIPEGLHGGTVDEKHR